MASRTGATWKVFEMNPAAPVGWYPTAEGGHERFWDGESWSAPRSRQLDEPAPAPIAVEASGAEDVADRNASGQPTHVYRDLPRYAECPPHALPTHDDVFLSKHRLGSPKIVRAHGRRTILADASVAWFVALWPAAATAALVAADVAAWSMSAVDTLMIALLASWYSLTLLDTAMVRSGARRAALPRRRPSMSWWWAVCPPAQLLARTRATHTTRLIPVLHVLSLLYPVVWLLPVETLDAIAASLSFLSPFLGR